MGYITRDVSVDVEQLHLAIASWPPVGGISFACFLNIQFYFKCDSRYRAAKNNECGMTDGGTEWAKRRFCLKKGTAVAANDCVVEKTRQTTDTARVLTGTLAVTENGCALAVYALSMQNQKILPFLVWNNYRSTPC